MTVSHMLPGQKALMFMRCYRVSTLILALLFMPGLSAAADIPDLLKKKGPAAKDIVTRPTISRVAPLKRLPVTPRQYEFLLDHPHLSMVLARICDPTLDLYRIETRPDGIYHVSEPAGIEGDVELVSSSPGKRLYFVSGHFLLLKMKFSGQMVVTNEYARQTGETEHLLDATSTLYIRLNSAFVGVFAKMLAYLFPGKVDERISRLSNAAVRVAVAVHDDPAGAYRRLAASGELGQGELQEFAGMFLKKP